MSMFVPKYDYVLPFGESRLSATFVQGADCLQNRNGEKYNLLSYWGRYKFDLGLEVTRWEGNENRTNKD